MSGIEIAGLVLGVFPLLIRALEGYREAAEVGRDWWRIQRAYDKCFQDLKYHQMILEGNIERFLLPLVVDDEEMKTLMADPAGEEWEDEELETRLKERLPKSYGVFLNIMSDITEIMEALKKELGVNNPKFQARINEQHKLVKPDGSRKDLLSSSNFEFQAKRIKFSLKKTSRQRLFNQLQEANERMRNILESSDRVTAARMSRGTLNPKSVVHRKANEFWRYAKGLHEALSDACRQCSSCSSHQANLQLEHRTSDEVEFNVLFDVGSTAGHKSWRATKIRMIQQGISNTLAGVSINTKPQNPALATPRQVRWTEPAKQPPTTANIDQTTKIKDLCSALSTNCPDCFGFLDNDEHRFAVYPVPKISTMANCSTITLRQLLQDTRVLTRRRRYNLALTLASSYLQLSSTPWLNSSLGKDSIVFLQDSSDPASMALERPYICREIARTPDNRAADAISVLGIRLLELCFGAPIEQTEHRKQFGEGNAQTAPYLDHAAALLWSRMVGEEAGPEFAEAIEWCLHAKEQPDGGWRKELWTQVIVPLDSCYSQVCHKPVFH